jgi:hypothetical protein
MSDDAAAAARFAEVIKLAFVDGLGVRSDPAAEQAKPRLDGGVSDRVGSHEALEGEERAARW